MKFSTAILTLLFFVSVCFLSCDKKSLPEVPNDPKVEPFQVELFKANRILIKNGLQLQCWVATDNYELGGKEGQPAYDINPSDWEKTGFTTPTFFGPPLMNLSYFKSFPSSQWAMAKAPYGTHLKSGPSDIEMKEGFLSADQKQYLKKLVSICFGDEESFSVPLISILKNWIEIVHKHYPDALAHNNQFAGQWSVADIGSYIQIAHPYLITYDWHYFHSWDNNNYKVARDMAKHLKVYRDLSLEGTHMTWVNQCNLESKNISDYLVRLKTSDVRYVGGTVKYTERVSDRVDIFNPSVGFVKRIKGSVMELQPGTQNNNVYRYSYDLLGGSGFLFNKFNLNKLL